MRDLGNSVLVVEHDEDTIRAADWVLDLGPGAGRHGGELVAEGTPEAIAAHPTSLTGRYLRGELQVAVPSKRRQGERLAPGDRRGAPQQPARASTCRFPLGTFTVVTGVSGSGKSSLVTDILHRALARHFYSAADRPGEHDRIAGLEHIDKVIAIDQSPIGRTPRSNPATYTNVFNPIRNLMAMTPEARARGYQAGRFSFNVKGGRCEACGGDGQIKIEMHFLPDIYVTCEVCGGKRYDRETLAVRYKGLNIAEILDLTVEQARDFFRAIPAIERVLATLDEVGLGYIHLGQSATTLSGGEAQRVKLATELCKRSTGRTLYLLDEPTTGLHFDDVRKLLAPPAPAGRQGQHGARRRAQPRRHQDRRLGDRPRPRRRRRRRPAGGDRHPRRGGAGRGRATPAGSWRACSRRRRRRRRARSARSRPLGAKPSRGRGVQSFDVTTAPNFSDRRRLLRLETLYDLALALHAEREEQDLLEELLGRVCLVLDPSAAVAVTRDAVAGARAVALVGWQGREPTGRALLDDAALARPAGRRPGGRAARRRARRPSFPRAGRGAASPTAASSSASWR